MVNKARKHKMRLPYRRYVGTGFPQLDQSEHSNTDDMREFSTEEPELPFTCATGEARVLPYEILDMIFGRCTNKYPLLFVSKTWHTVALPHVYNCPDLNHNNYASFVRAVSTSRNLGRLVCELNLVRIVQVGKNSMISRLLYRCSPRLEQFVAPQSHFGLSPITSLAKCQRLRVLDLGLVTEKVDLPAVLKAVEEFQSLEVLNFPRSSISCGDNYNLKWPPNLTRLGLAGGITSRFLANTILPCGIRELTISNCPFIDTEAFLTMLSRIGNQLERLAVVFPLPLVSSSALDNVLLLCRTRLESLTVSVDYVSSDFLECDNIPPCHPLTTLSLISSGMVGHGNKIRPGDVLLASEALSRLKYVRTSFQLGWNPQSSALMGLVDVMTERGGGVWLE